MSGHSGLNLVFRKKLQLTSLDEKISEASKICSEIDADVFFYNGPLVSGKDLECIEEIHKGKSREKALILMTTHGGDPDAAYKISRYLQDKYAYTTMLVSGRCKSAGTLVALGANELVFTPYGELGPLDIQLSKVDRFDQLQSGLTIQDSLITLEQRAIERYMAVVHSYMSANNGLLSFASATKAAAELVTQLYAPVFARIDPEEVGARARSMRIATDYGRRLALKSQNLRGNTLKLLAETYPSHSFVIDRTEAETLFLRVRAADEKEMRLVKALGKYARFDMSGSGDVVFRSLSAPSVDLKRSGSDADAHPRGRPKSNDGNTQRATGTSNATPKRAKRRIQRKSLPASNGVDRSNGARKPVAS